MNWQELTSVNQISDLVSLSQEPEKIVLIFKHSTRCSVSFFAKKNFERQWVDTPNFTPFYLDLLEHRDVSNELASMFNIQHESPQVLVLQGGDCVFHASHHGIDATDIQTNFSSN